MIRLSNTLKRLMKVGAILFGLAFIIAGVIGIRQDDTFLPTKAVIQSMEARTMLLIWARKRTISQ